MFKILVSLIILLNLFIFPTLILAQEQKEEVKVDIGSLVKKVDHVANIQERLQERISLFFKFSNESKIDYQKHLTEKRLAELIYVIENQKGDFIEETSSRYSTYLGRLTETVIQSRLSGRKDEFFQMFNNHKMILNELIKPFESNSGFWLLLKHDINSLELYSEQLKNFK